MYIQEDYVSFEVAKLLKEKGFEQHNPDVEMYYRENGEYSAVVGDEVYWIDSMYAAPTLQMAMKFLRKVHNLSVEVYRTACGYIGCIVAIPSGTDIKFLDEDGDDYSGQYTTWESACEAAIKYCLENLMNK